MSNPYRGRPGCLQKAMHPERKHYWGFNPSEEKEVLEYIRHLEHTIIRMHIPGALPATEDERD